MTRIAIIGLGTMGSAIATGLVASGGVTPGDIVVTGHGDARTRADGLGLTWAEDPLAAARAAELVVVAVKPKDFPAVCAQIADAFDGSRVLVSIAGGLGLEALADLVPAGTPIVRVMPNTPVAHRAGVCVVSRDELVGDERAAEIVRLFSLLGGVVELPESLMDPATALAGCGPAFIYQVIEGLADGAVAEGLPRRTAYELAARMVAGAGTTVLESGEHPGRLKDDVTTPGGSTIRGVLALERAGVRAAFADAIAAAAGSSRGAR